MNERIKELMKQADYPAPELALRAHKLAELIIQECTEVTADWYKNHNQYHMPPDEHIKAHFGVENE